MESVIDQPIPAIGGTRLLSQVLMDRAEPVPEAGCWIWSYSESNGKYLKYGRQSFNGRVYHAHRLSYLLFRGPIPQGMRVCHSCDTPLCINPDHLWLGSDYQNCADKIAKGRHQHGSRHWSAKLGESEVLEIRDSQDSFDHIAIRYGITVDNVKKIRSRRSWRHL